MDTLSSKLLTDQGDPLERWANTMFEQFVLAATYLTLRRIEQAGEARDLAAASPRTRTWVVANDIRDQFLGLDSMLGAVAAALDIALAEGVH